MDNVLDFVPYAMKYVWIKLSFTKNPRRAQVVGMDFENNRLLLRYENKYHVENITYHYLDDVITPEQLQKLKMPELWDKKKNNVKKQKNIRGSSSRESSVTKGAS